MESPWVFLYNAFLIFTTFMVVYLFRRRVLVRLIMSCFWLLLGIINGVILANRVTPFTGPDLRNLSDGAKVVTKYLSKGTMILVAAALVALLAFFVWVWIKGPKFQGKIRWYLNVPLIALVTDLQDEEWRQTVRLLCETVLKIDPQPLFELADEIYGQREELAAIDVTAMIDGAMKMFESENYCLSLIHISEPTRRS